MRLTRLFVFALLVPGPLCAQAKHTPTLEETVSLKKIDSPKISPDGRFVAYRVRDVNWKDNEFVSQIRIVNVATGDGFPLTQGRKSAGQME